MKILAKVLLHKTKPGVHGTICHGRLYESGIHLVPQLFPNSATREWIDSCIKDKDSVSISLDEFRLVTVVVEPISEQ